MRKVTPCFGGLHASLNTCLLLGMLLYATAWRRDTRLLHDIDEHSYWSVLVVIGFYI